MVRLSSCVRSLQLLPILSLLAAVPLHTHHNTKHASMCAPIQDSYEVDANGAPVSKPVPCKTPKPADASSVEDGIKITPEMHADALWARNAGYSEEIISLAKFRGRPCHIESYDGGDNYQKVTFWYCDADDHYSEAYTFLNGHQISHYEP